MKKNKSLTKGGAYYLLYNVLNSVFPFLSGIYIARKIFPEDIGRIAAAQNLTTYFVILSFLGIPTYGLREIAKLKNDLKERSRVYSELFLINLISTCFFMLCYIVLVVTVQEYRESLRLYLIVGISIALNMFNISWLYDGLEEFRFIALRNLAIKIIALCSLFIFVRGPEDYLAYAFITVLGVAGNHLINILFAPRFIKFTFKHLNLKRHLKSIFYLVTVNLAIELYSLMDITMMNFMSTKDSIAFYKYGHGILLILLQMINTVTYVLIPRITFYFSKKRFREFNLLISNALKLIILCSVPMIIGIYFTADFLLTQLYGDQYVVSAKILKIFSFLLLVTPIGYLLGSRVLLVTGNEKKMIISVGSGAIVNFIANFLLIPRYSEFGATIASVISEIVVMVVYVSLGRSYYKLSGVKKTVFKVLIAGLFTAAHLFLCTRLSFNPFLILALQALGAFVYLFILLFLKEDITWFYVNRLKKAIA